MKLKYIQLQSLVEVLQLFALYNQIGWRDDANHVYHIDDLPPEVYPLYIGVGDGCWPSTSTPRHEGASIIPFWQITQILITKGIDIPSL